MWAVQRLKGLTILSFKTYNLVTIENNIPEGLSLYVKSSSYICCVCLTLHIVPSFFLYLFWAYCFMLSRLSDEAGGERVP